MTTFGDIRDEGNHYQIGIGDAGPWILKKTDPGKALTHLLKNPEQNISLEFIIGMTRWNDPQMNMNDLARRVNKWSRTYRIERMTVDGERHYKLTKKENASNNSPITN